MQRQSAGLPARARPGRPEKRPQNAGPPARAQPAGGRLRQPRAARPLRAQPGPLATRGQRPPVAAASPERRPDADLRWPAPRLLARTLAQAWPAAQPRDPASAPPQAQPVPDAAPAALTRPARGRAPPRARRAWPRQTVHPNGPADPAAFGRATPSSGGGAGDLPAMTHRGPDGRQPTRRGSEAVRHRRSVGARSPSLPGRAALRQSEGHGHERAPCERGLHGWAGN